MDNLVLIRVTDVLDRSLAGSVLRDLRQESAHRYRLIFELGERPLSVVVSVEPRQPWLGRPSARGPASRRPLGRFAASARHYLRGGVVASVAKGEARSATIRFADGRKLVAELVPHRANLLLVDREDRIQSTARSPRADRARVASGAVYVPLGLPPGCLDPVCATGAEIDEWLARRPAGGESDPAAYLARQLFGLAEPVARVVLEETRTTGRSAGEVLAGRVRRLRDAEDDPVVEGPTELLRAAERGEADSEDWRLLPWEPDGPPCPTHSRVRRADAAATAGLFHTALEAGREARDRSQGLLRILAAEIKRQRRAEVRIASDLASFEDPERYRLWGEALLAGLHQARRSGEHVLVPDPYDTTGRLLSIPVPGDRSPQQAAEALFRRSRRASRGLRHARERARGTLERRTRLERLFARFEGLDDAGSMAELAQAMRGMGLAVELEPAGGRRVSVAPARRPRLEGVRLLTGPEGQTILVGKGGKENDRLTFKLAGPEDFWLHALGVPGAHVVVRNEARLPRPPESLLRVAAAVAAWFSDSRTAPEVDVQWTRRKYVRRLKGARPGTVKVKKSETVRVRPRLPAATNGPSRP